MLLVALVSFGCITSCYTERRYWSFPLSRLCYRASSPRDSVPSFPAGGGDDHNLTAFALVPVLFLPFVVDVVILPVTGVHDGYVALAH
jgi:hypothetical protein